MNRLQHRVNPTTHPVALRSAKWWTINGKASINEKPSINEKASINGKPCPLPCATRRLLAQRWVPAVILWWFVGFGIVATGCQPDRGLAEWEKQSRIEPVQPSDEVEQLIEQLTDNDVRVRAAAAVKLAEHPDEVAAFFEPLSRALGDESPEVANAAKLAFNRLGEAAVDLVGPLVTSDDYLEFTRACEIINSIGPPAARWLPQLAEKLESDDVYWRQAAVYAMIPMKERVVPYYDRFAELLLEEDWHAHTFICRLVIDSGPIAKSLSPQLIQVAEEGVPSARSYAYWALGALGPQEDFDVVQFLITRLDAFLMVERERALRGLAELGQDAAAAVEPVRQLATDEDKNVEPYAAYTLWKITGEPEEATQLLVDLFSDLTHQYRAFQMLEKMGPDAADAQDFFVQQLDHPDESIRELAIRCLGNIQVDSPTIIEKLRHIRQNDPAEWIRMVARETLEHLGHAGDDQADQ